MQSLINNWSEGGTMYNYFIEELKIKPKIVDTFSELKAKGRHKKLTTDGIVGVELSFEKI